MTPISPAYTREDLIAMIRNRDAMVSDLKTCLEEAVRERENYNGFHQSAVMEIDRLRKALEAVAAAKMPGEARRIAAEALAGDAGGVVKS